MLIRYVRRENTSIVSRYLCGPIIRNFVLFAFNFTLIHPVKNVIKKLSKSL